MTSPTATVTLTDVTIPTYAVDDDMVILLGSITLVSSRSNPSAWRIIEQGRCSCPGFAARGHCRHMDAAHAAEEQDRETAQPARVVYPEPAGVAECLDFGHDYGYLPPSLAPCSRSVAGWWACQACDVWVLVTEERCPQCRLDATCAQG